MKIGVIGSGKIGATSARLFAEAGHSVWIANSRGPESLVDSASEIGVQPATVEQAFAEADVILVAIPLGRYRELPRDAAAGKIVIDADNYYPGRDGQIGELDADETTSSELLADHLRGARVVKAFNTMYFKTLAEQGDASAPGSDRLALLVSGDDGAAKAVVAQLIDQIGFTAVDMGSLADGGRRQQPGSPLYNEPLTAAEAQARRDG